MKHLKIVSPGFETYTGPVGPVPFKDGVSVDPVPELFARRVAAAMRVVWVDEEGNEEDASVAHALIRDSAMRAPVLETLERQTDDEKKAERRASVLKTVGDDVTLHSRNDLLAVVQAHGVKALREIGNTWHVKHKQAAALIDMILAEQAKWIEARNAKLAAAGVAQAPVEDGDAGNADQVPDGDSNSDGGAGEPGPDAAPEAEAAGAETAEAGSGEPEAEGASPTKSEADSGAEKAE